MYLHENVLNFKQKKKNVFFNFGEVLRESAAQYAHFQSSTEGMLTSRIITHLLRKWGTKFKYWNKYCGLRN